MLWTLGYDTMTRKQCRINNGANGAAAPGPPQLGAPHKGFFFCTLSFCTLDLRQLTAPPRPPAVLHAASGSVGLGHRGSHSPREKPPTKVLHQAPHIGNPALQRSHWLIECPGFSILLVLIIHLSGSSSTILNVASKLK